jgi:hypothetical protein
MTGDSASPTKLRREQPPQLEIDICQLMRIYRRRQREPVLLPP